VVRATETGAASMVRPGEWVAAAWAVAMVAELAVEMAAVAVAARWVGITGRLASQKG